MTTREEIDKTIEDLRRLIEQAVRNEQLRHQLTGLPNATALAGHLQSAMESAIDRDEQFWLGSSRSIGSSRSTISSGTSAPTSAPVGAGRAPRLEVHRA